MEQSLASAMPAKETDLDATLVDRYVAGDMTAFDELMVRYQRQVHRLCYRYVENSEDALDLAQEVFIKVFEKLPSFRRESALRTWIYRIAINHCLNHVKKHRHEFVEVTERVGSYSPKVQAHLEHEEQRATFRRLMKHLPPKQKAILELRVNEQLSYEEIAKISGRSVSTIKASVFFALAKLKKLVKESHYVRAS